jgi:hypothetical protein
VRQSIFVGPLLAALAFMFPSISIAQHDHHGSELASHGLGQTLPHAANLSLLPAWRVYAFERDGISYYQVNDDLGRVHVILAKAGREFWTLPAGDSYAVVSLPSNPRNMLPGADRQVVFRDAEFALALYDDGAAAVWSVETSP